MAEFRIYAFMLILTALVGLSACGSGGGAGNADNDPPIVAMYSPDSGADFVPVGGPFSVTFSEEMDPATLTQAAVYLTGPSGAVAATLLFYDSTAELILSAPLDYGTSYTVTVTTAVTDLAGIPLIAPVSWTFTTEDEPDFTPPTVTVRVPAPGAVGVSTAATVNATFSEAIFTPTLTGDGFTLTGPSGAVAGTLGYAGTTVTFTPSSPLAYATEYTAVLSAAVGDYVGNTLEAPVVWTFTTAGQSGGGATLSVDGSTTLNGTSTILNPPNLTGLNESAGSGNAGSSVFMTTGSATLTVSGVTTLNNSTTITGGVSTNTLTLFDPLAYIQPPDLTPPEVASTYPGEGAAGTAINSAITATFSEALDPATVTVASFTLTTPSGAVAGTVDYAGTTATFTPSAALANAAEYTATLTTALKDLAGNTLAAPVVWTFTTASQSGGGDVLVVNGWSAGSPNTQSSSGSNVTGSTDLDSNLNVDGTVSVEGATVIGNTLGIPPPLSPLTVTGSNGTAGSGNADSSLTINDTSGVTGLIIHSTQTTLTGGISTNTLTLFDPLAYIQPADLTPPEATLPYPVAEAEGVSVDTEISATFSEEMDAASFDGASFTLTGPSGAVAGTVGYAGTTATFTPDAALAYAAEYTATLTITLEDLAGNPLETPASWTFTTEAGP